MTKKYKSPGVYIQEKNAFPNAVVSVHTAVPAFVGYTEKATRNSKSLINIPTRITSLAEYNLFYEKGPDIKYDIKNDPTGEFVLEEIRSTRFYLYNSLRLFFANGGGACYIVSVGNYEAKIEKDDLEKGISTLRKTHEPTMLVIPDAIALDEQDCFNLQKMMLKHCGLEMKNRIALLDVYNGFKAPAMSREDDVVKRFGEGIGNKHLRWGAAYYPWLNTSIVQDDEINFKKNISNLKDLEKMLNENIHQHISDQQKADLIKAGIEKISKSEVEIEKLHQTLLAVCQLYQRIIYEIKTKMNILPPSAAMAGVITMVDNTRGVWKSPANVSIASVISPTTSIDDDTQEKLNGGINGKAINALRSFIGEGVLVWGAGTLDMTSADWRYINVNRTAIMLEQSLKLAARAYVFEPNDKNTWLMVKGMMTSFLMGQWKQGALSGAVPEDAFSVDIGLGLTMSTDDILDGIMRVTIKVALVRPAEFIVITLQQQMQKS